MSYDHMYNLTTRDIRGKTRQLYCPNKELKALQREALNEIKELRASAYCHGYQPNTSRYTATTPHQNQFSIVTTDIKEYFASITAREVFSCLRGHRFSIKRSSELTAIMTYKGKLPFGAVTSPYMSDLVMWRLDMELGLWSRHKGIIYTRYADDLLFSSSRQIDIEVLLYAVDMALMMQQLRRNPNKTKINPTQVLGVDMHYALEPVLSSDIPL